MAATTRSSSSLRHAEEAVLGAILITEGRAYWEIADLLGESDFLNGNHRLVYRAIVENVQAERPVDAVTLGEWMDRKGDDLPGGASSYLIELAMSTASAAMIRSYAEIVRNAALARRVEQAGERIAAIGRTGGDEAYSAAVGALQAVAPQTLREVEGSKAVLRKVVANMQAMLKRKHGELAGIAFGLEELDGGTNGMQEGQLIIVAGRPSMGKTAIALQVALSCGKQNIPAMVCSMEMPSEQLAMRALSNLSGVTLPKILDPRLSDDEDMPRVYEAASTLQSMPLFFDDSSSVPVETVCTRVRQAVMQHGIRVVVIDYLQFFALQDPSNTNASMQHITRMLKSMAKELKITVVLLSQLNRSLEARGDKRPIMSDLRDSGAIEQDADVILFLYRDEYYNPESGARNVAEIRCAKQRNGPTFTMFVGTNLACQRFFDTDYQPDPDDAKPKRQERGFSGPRRGNGGAARAGSYAERYGTRGE